MVGVALVVVVDVGVGEMPEVVVVEIVVVVMGLV